MADRERAQAQEVKEAPELGELLDERQAAAILNTGVQTLRNWRWNGTGPVYCKIGARMVRYRRADLARFINDGASVATAEQA
ncbi:MAG: DNA-binding protein [Burkholderiaceae bacterium]|nr:MAG: DNA-binding protein [Burkholderiaceae bacterium]